MKHYSIEALKPLRSKYLEYGYVRDHFVLKSFHYDPDIDRSISLFGVRDYYRTKNYDFLLDSLAALRLVYISGIYLTCLEEGVDSIQPVFMRELELKCNKMVLKKEIDIQIDLIGKRKFGNDILFHGEFRVNQSFKGEMKMVMKPNVKEPIPQIN